MTAQMLDSAEPLRMAQAQRKRVLNVGCGPREAGRLHATFRGTDWVEIRVDIDPLVGPDVVGSLADLRAVLPDGTVDAIWCSHSLEHLPGHEVIPALQECRRVLTPDGFALITCPDLVAVAEFILLNGIDSVAYVSPSGPITPLDIIFGHGASIGAGREFMAHKTGFTVERLGRLATEAGFSETWVTRGPGFDLWAVLLKPETSAARLRMHFANSNVGLLFPAGPPR